MERQRRELFSSFLFEQMQGQQRLAGTRIPPALSNSSRARLQTPKRHSALGNSQSSITHRNATGEQPKKKKKSPVKKEKKTMYM